MDDDKFWAKLERLQNNYETFVFDTDVFQKKLKKLGLPSSTIQDILDNSERKRET